MMFYLQYSRLFGDQCGWSYRIRDFLIFCACFSKAILQLCNRDKAVISNTYQLCEVSLEIAALQHQLFM